MPDLVKGGGGKEFFTVYDARDRRTTTVGFLRFSDVKSTAFLLINLYLQVLDDILLSIVRR